MKTQTPQDYVILPVVAVMALVAALMITVVAVIE
jgi:hypothetical protein